MDRFPSGAPAPLFPQFSAAFRLISLLWPAALLAGCTAQSSRPGIRVETVEVVREVQRPCPVTAPTRPAPIGALPADAVALAAALGAKLAEWSGPGGYGDRAEAAIATCARKVSSNP